MSAKDICLFRTLVAIVDDDLAGREALSELLQVMDVACRTFDRAEAFMAEFEPDCFDCPITDVSMPASAGLIWCGNSGASVPPCR
ncbi:response regulator [Tardiphaga sp. 813_E8_N1_3]|uniref:response regulator n=1 Tax=Tardiphaga sp. 813_E8_N1_3 TaxID=3240760 RepID=UPI003F20236C